MIGVERAGTRGSLGLNKMQNALQSLIVQTTGTNRVAGTLISTLGSFALGGGVMLAVTGGIAALTKGYDLLTASTRRAREEGDKATQSLIAQARAQRGATLAGLEDLKVIEEAKLQAIRRESGVGIRSGVLSLLTGKPMIDVADAEAQLKRVADAELGVTQATKNWTDAWAKSNEPLKTANSNIKEMTFGFNQLREAADRVYTETAKDTKDFWRGYIEQTKAALSLTEQLNNAINAERPSLLQAFRSVATVPIPDVSMPSIGLDDGLTKEQIKSRDALIGNADANTDRLRDAIWGSATQMANSIVGALNIGGGGKGSGLGGALGGTAGFAAGFAIGGPIGGAIGSTIGNIAGSLFGGLFDSGKKDVSALTQALRQNTAAQLLNTPSGYKTAAGRFDATDVKDFRRGLQRYATRGGAPILVGP